MRLSLLALGFALLASACERPPHEDCERLCWRYSELQFWAAFEAQAKELSAEDRATLRSERQLEWDQLRKQPKNPGRDNCLTACKKGGKRSQVACIDRAKTADQATACLERD